MGHLVCQCCSFRGYVQYSLSFRLALRDVLPVSVTRANFTTDFLGLPFRLKELFLQSQQEWYREEDSDQVGDCH